MLDSISCCNNNCLWRLVIISRWSNFTSHFLAVESWMLSHKWRTGVNSGGSLKADQILTLDERTVTDNTSLPPPFTYRRRHMDPSQFRSPLRTTHFFTVSKFYTLSHLVSCPDPFPIGVRLLYWNRSSKMSTFHTVASLLANFNDTLSMISMQFQDVNFSHSGFIASEFQRYIIDHLYDSKHFCDSKLPHLL